MWDKNGRKESIRYKDFFIQLDNYDHHLVKAVYVLPNINIYMSSLDDKISVINNLIEFRDELNDFISHLQGVINVE